MDRQDVAEALDDDKLPDELPPEEPLGVDEYGVTDREEAIEEPIEERVTREEPERRPPEDRPVGHLVEPDAGGGPDDEPDAVASEASSITGEPITGEPITGEHRDAGDIASGDATLRDVATERGGDAPAEEAAVHETEPPPMGDGDGYIEDEEGP